MKYIFAIIGSVVVTVTLVAFFFNLNQINEERATLSINLEQRATLLSDSLKESVEPTYANSSQETLKASLQKTVDRFANRERLAGIALYDNKGTLLATSAGLPKTIIENTKSVSDAMDSNNSKSDFFDADGENRYVFVDPLHNDDGNLLGALMIVQNAGYINTSINEIWRGNLLRLVVQIIIFSITIFIILRFIVFRQVLRLVKSTREIRMGENNEALKDADKYSFFSPLAREITQITKSLSQARSSASEEARMRLEKLDTPWTGERLKEFIKAYLKDRKIFVVSNQEPYIHQKIKNEIRFSMVPSGLNTAVNSVMEACGGVWIAHGSGDADKETSDENGKLQVPPNDPRYTLKRIWLSEKEFSGHYSFSVEAIYPLCLMTYTRPVFRKENWIMYKHVNKKFAQALLKELKDVEQPIILIQDYHFALLPQMIKDARPDAEIGIFWHVPWPSPEAFSVCPWRKEILKGMLGADIVGFNTQQFCNNFIDTIGKEVESLIDLETFSITRENHTTHIKSFPISIAFSNGKETAVEQSEFNSLGLDILKKLGIQTKYLGIGVDRLDHAKGIPERFLGIEHFFEVHPEYKGQLTFLQIASPHREHFKSYQEQYQNLITKEANRVNEKFGTKEWKPIVLETTQYGQRELLALYKIAHFCLITSLHDSMNLVAKEYVSARNDSLGVLILSQFAGASRNLKEALIINPHHTEEIGAAIYTALSMPQEEQYRRMNIMRTIIKDYNVYRWAAEFIKSVTSLN
ncbi:MAG TPA: trehalose-6-phosphate synthase [Candidatus Paceibacterota bacterium]|nr:trehalose-6-phosphate synthase [Candidatus Paceibacterota bacterium]